MHFHPKRQCQRGQITYKQSCRDKHALQHHHHLPLPGGSIFIPSWTVSHAKLHQTLHHWLNSTDGPHHKATRRSNLHSIFTLFISTERAAPKERESTRKKEQNSNQTDSTAIRVSSQRGQVLQIHAKEQVSMTHRRERERQGRRIQQLGLLVRCSCFREDKETRVAFPTNMQCTNFLLPGKIVIPDCWITWPS